MNIIKYAALEFWRLVGLRGPADLLDSALGIKAFRWGEFNAQAAAAIVITFLSNYVWKPPYALVLLLVLDIANGYYGWRVAVVVKGERWRGEEAHRTFGKLFATFFICALLRGAIVAYPYYDPIAHILFGWLFTRKMAKLAQKMAALKVQEAGLPNLFRQAVQAVLLSKYGEDLVKGYQKAKAPEADTTTEQPTDTTTQPQP